MLSGIVDGTVYGGPYHLEFDWVDRCNANCHFCISRDIRGGEHLSWGLAQKLLEEAVAGGLRSIRTSGGGEPLLHANYTDLLVLLGRNGVVLDNLTTNGTLLDERVTAGLMELRVGEVIISLNYPTAEPWSQGMGLPERLFGRTVDNVKRLCEAKRGRPEFGRVILQFLVYRPTVNLLREAYELSREIGADAVLFRELGEIDPAMFYAAEDVPAILAQMGEIIRADWQDRRVECHLKSHGMSVELDKIYRELRGEETTESQPAPAAPAPFNRYCYIGWYSMTLMGNQDVYPCCFLMSNQKNTPHIDNMKGKTLSDTWRGPAYRQFRSQIRDYQVLERQVPFFERRATLLARSCATHDFCPLTTAMCDEDYYAAADRLLEPVRRRPANRARLFGERVGGVCERHLVERRSRKHAGAGERT